MTSEDFPILATTKVAALLDHYPELEETLIAMAPPFKKLRNPILRRSVAKVASLRQAAAVGRVSVDDVVNALRAAVGQPSLSTEEGPADAGYFGAEPDWFDQGRVVQSIDESVDVEDDSMALNLVNEQGKKLASGEILELRTSFLPVPGIDIMRQKGFRSWSVEDAPDRIRTYFIRFGDCPLGTSPLATASSKPGGGAA